eukprot:TRINITY_DN2453_c0_g1::TRINITY_DN2453_c0_g1_i2::g.8811::m.8811 TRINITY_DN2453_c0_g1::TRINITY_DN2453_c0_g1_i2::g.8811  ORF type:complete len:143 (+),score=5.00,DUF260/PF03195.9/2,DUF260/PF03195.9/0.93,VWA_3/PF13768.1/0.45,DUF4233/PF14017.1/1.8,DUF4233/PF14017.1/1.1e+02,MRP-L20/PF12824.2/18,MRP-L20/PF12824.2/25 TRINITY_DN2453_c0_g1_i2:190-618(+)
MGRVCHVIHLALPPSVALNNAHSQMHRQLVLSAPLTLIIAMVQACRVSRRACPLHAALSNAFHHHPPPQALSVHLIPQTIAMVQACRVSRRACPLHAALSNAFHHHPPPQALSVHLIPMFLRPCKLFVAVWIYRLSQSAKNF